MLQFTETIMPIQDAKFLHAALRIQITINFMICHYQYNYTVDIMPTVTMV